MIKKTASSTPRQRLLEEFWDKTSSTSKILKQSPSSVLKEAVNNENSCSPENYTNGSQYSHNSYQSQFSDEMEYLTPQDQPVNHIFNPPTPSPIKKRHRRSLGGILKKSDEVVASLTQDMDVLDVRNVTEDINSNFNMRRNSVESDEGVLPTTRRCLASAVKPRHPPSANLPKTDRIRQSSTRFPEANINPFLVIQSDAASQSTEKRKRPPTRQMVLPCGTGKLKQNATLLSRYLHDFIEIEEIGRGSFSRVYKCIKRIDGCFYAVKKSTRRSFGRADRQIALKEVYALSLLAHCKYIARYFDAWFEDDYLYIQLEYCSGGSLDKKFNDLIEKVNPEAVLLEVLKDVSSALKEIHAANLVHLDIKPSNILISSIGHYKVTDFGQVSKADGSMEVYEGDNRYLSRELLEGSRQNLKASDIFALGTTIYELALGRNLLGYGDEWQAIRNGQLSEFPLLYSDNFKSLIVLMMNPDPLKRPTNEQILTYCSINAFKTPDSNENED